MTKTTLKALYLGGGGVLATWLAVTPNHGVPTSATAVQRPAVSRESTDDLITQTELLRSRNSIVALRPSKRNPFRFTARRSIEGAPTSSGSSAPATALDMSAPAPPQPPLLTLAGVTEKKTSDGSRRTAVITSAGQMYLVGEGDSIAGRYTVVKIDPDAVLIRDATGAEIRLAMQ